jgi:hypothetical protein
MMKRLRLVSLAMVAILTLAPGTGLGHGEKTGSEDSTKAAFEKEIQSVLGDERLSAVKVEVAAIFESLKTEGLPLEPFLSKIREGLVKKVDPGKIVKALGTLEGRYGKAASLLDEKKIPASSENLAAVVDMISAGVNEKSVGLLLAGIKDKAPKLEKQALTELSFCVIRLRDGGLGEEEAVVKTIKIFDKKGLAGVQSEIIRMKPSSSKGPDKKTDSFKHQHKPGKGKGIKGFGGKKAGK